MKENQRKEHSPFSVTQDAPTWRRATLNPFQIFSETKLAARKKITRLLIFSVEGEGVGGKSINRLRAKLRLSDVLEVLTEALPNRTSKSAVRRTKQGVAL